MIMIVCVYVKNNKRTSEGESWCHQCQLCSGAVVADLTNFVSLSYSISSAHSLQLPSCASPPLPSPRVKCRQNSYKIQLEV